MKLITYLLTISIIYSQLPTIKFDCTSSVITAGQSTTLSWDVKNASAVYISGIGNVDSKGSQVVNPKYSTVYTLIAESPSGLESKYLRVTVRGGRDQDPSPSYDQFLNPIEGNRKVNSFVYFIEKIRILLQDEMGFTVEPVQKIGERFVFITSYSQKGYLVQDHERSIRARDISYMVELDPGSQHSQEIRYTIKSRIRFYPRGQSTPKLEGNKDLYRSEADRLRLKIISIS